MVSTLFSASLSMLCLQAINVVNARPCCPPLRAGIVSCNDREFDRECGEMCVGNHWFSLDFVSVDAHQICRDQGYPGGAHIEHWGFNWGMQCLHPSATIKGKPNKVGGPLSELTYATTWRCVNNGEAPTCISHTRCLGLEPGATVAPTLLPTALPSALPTALPTACPSLFPSLLPTAMPTTRTRAPSARPTTRSITPYDDPFDWAGFKEFCGNMATENFECALCFPIEMYPRKCAHLGCKPSRGKSSVCRAPKNSRKVKCAKIAFPRICKLVGCRWEAEGEVCSGRAMFP